jgi:hypothetical protein
MRFDEFEPRSECRETIRKFIAREDLRDETKMKIIRQESC